MPVYEYKALDGKGRAVSGIVNADSGPAARQKLRGSEVYPVTIRQSRHGNARVARGRFAFLRIFARIQPAQLAVMTRQLAILIGSGFPLVSAMNALIAQTRPRAFQSILAQVKEAIVEGRSFADALALFPEVFSKMYVHMVHAGERSGTLEMVMNRLAELLEKQQALHGRIRAAMAYPILMAGVSILVLSFLLSYIVPTITTVFIDMDQTLPAPTRVLIELTRLVQSSWPALLCMMAIPAVLVLGIGRIPRGRRLRDRFHLQLPLIGSLEKKRVAARFARTLGILLKSGVPLTDSLAIVENTTGNIFYAEVIEDAGTEVARGKDLAAALAISGVFPKLALQMIRVGEETGKLEAMLLKVADGYDSEVEMQMAGMTSLLEPLMILAMGLVVGAIVISICLPIFEMNQLVM